MVKVQVLLFGALVASSASAAPVHKRIAQVITEATAKWEQACLKAGGGQKCNPQSIASFDTLLIAPGPCEQQDQADNMIDLAHSLNNDPDMIRLTQIFAQQPRNTPNSQAVPYCQKAPRNAELKGLFQCQYQGANQVVFVGGASVGQAGTIPFGLNAPVSPPGSCKAHTSGPLADGSQLVAITNDPGVGGGTGAAAPPPAQAPPPAPAAQNGAASAPAAGGDFHLANAQDAQALNAKFATLTASSACTDGENACVGGKFAQCVAGKFAITGCAGGTECVALPLVNSRGTSITCDTAGDAADRFSQAGASGTGLAARAGRASKSKPAASSFQLANGHEAQALNKKFASLSASSPCTSGEHACVGGKLAQCAGGKFSISACAAGLQCFALPLVNSRGTSVTCDTRADAAKRIADTGAKGGITG
ncbi:hypothetical protein BDN72DRAFT_462375 [Pluteus cervinus]|uniref:Uncharacterized protein n=1 Tax=Pluteus cervinus TaxID=181527 RepID=A0ACD3B0B8_9AGAR|nr:hypothetical protein BDN72DRAFT_462375 [Pluteus cervinus]